MRGVQQGIAFLEAFSGGLVHSGLDWLARLHRTDLTQDGGQEVVSLETGVSESNDLQKLLLDVL